MLVKSQQAIFKCVHPSVIDNNKNIHGFVNCSGFALTPSQIKGAAVAALPRYLTAARVHSL